MSGGGGFEDLCSKLKDGGEAKCINATVIEGKEGVSRALYPGDHPVCVLRSETLCEGYWKFNRFSNMRFIQGLNTQSQSSLEEDRDRIKSLSDEEEKKLRKIMETA